jgi:hypothetical protein
MEPVAVVAQKLWLRRNKAVFGGVVLPPTFLVKSAKESLKAFHLSKAQPSFPRRAQAKQQTKWTKPPSGQIKINWDVVVDQKNKLMGL